MFGKKSRSDPKGPLDPRQRLPLPGYPPMAERVPAICRPPVEGTEWYPAPLLGAATLGQRIAGGESTYVSQACDLVRALSPDEYGTYMIAYYQDGLKRYGAGWAFADLVTVLLGLSETLKPRRYLEVGVRRGRSVCAVAKKSPACDVVLFDMWVKNYAGMDNPGPELVKSELARVGHKGRAEFIDGNSHETLPKWFRTHPDATFDLITVDGDHTNLGAAQDLCDVLPRLAIGGAIAFDDIAHPKHPGLAEVWRRMVVEDRRFSAWSYADAGYGVGFAVRKW